MLDGSGAYRFAALMKRGQPAEQLPSIKALVRSVLSAATRLPWERSRRIRYERELVEQSGLFDADWYLRAYPDVAQSGIDPLDHFIAVGWRESRNPGPLFTTSRYLRANEDVAESGGNPLLHFIEFGISEGREGFGDGSALPLTAVESFVPLGQASSCVSFPHSRGALPQWLRHDELDRGDDRLVAIGNSPIGYAKDPHARAAIQAAIDQFRFLSGAPDADAAIGVESPFHGGQQLADAWYANSLQLRMRWTNGSTATVVRVFQCGPRSSDQALLVGEGAVASDLDWLDAHLQNPYLPLLCVFTKAEGEISGHCLIPFPSLRRGGLHYPELLWAADAQPLDPNKVTTRLAERLIARRLGRITPAITDIVVDRALGDGDGPMFRPDFRLWMERVFGIEVRFTSSDNSPPSRIGTAGSSLVLPVDGAPTIAALLEPNTSLVAGEDQAVPVLFSKLNPGAPILSAKVCVNAEVLGKGGGFPIIRGNSAAHFPPAAIRPSEGDRLAEAELLLPSSAGLTETLQQRSPITWLIDATDSNPEEVLQTVQTLNLQAQAACDAIALIGTPRESNIEGVRRRFAGPVALFTSPTSAIEALSTELAGLIAPGVLLHDRHTAGQFAAMLQNEAVATASCVLVSASRHGGMLQAAIVDAGTMANKEGRIATAQEAAQAASELWRESYPVSAPSTWLWAARTSTLQARRIGLHLCSSKVTAIAPTGGVPRRDEQFQPANETAIQISWLVG